MPTAHRSRTTWSLLLALLLGLLVVAGTIRSAQPARAATFVIPWVSVNPASGDAAEPVQLTGADFTPFGTLAADFFSPSTGAVPLGTFQADAAGMFIFDTAVPATAQPGPAAFGVRNVDNPDEAASTTFSVTAAKDGDDGGENGDDGEIGDDEPKKPEFCKVTITLKSVQVTSNRIADGTVIGNTVDTIPASKGAPGASVDVDDLVVGGDATVVDKVAREYVVPKRGGFPHRVLVSAKILRNDPFKRAFFSGPVKKIVLCPSSHDVEAIVEALLSGVGETFTLKYQIEVTEVEAQ